MDYRSGSGTWRDGGGWYENQEVPYLNEPKLWMRGFSVDVGVVEGRESVGGKRVRSKREADFVANLGSRRYYIQSAFRIESPEKAAQEKTSLRAMDDSFKKIVMVRDPVHPYMDDDGILTMGLFDFLLDPDSLGR